MSKTILHRNIILPGVVIGLFVAVVGYVLGQNSFSLGLLFSLPIALANLKAIDKILTIGFGLSVPVAIRVVAFLIYHLRFFLLVVIMYLVIPKAGNGFAIGTFAGFIIAKITLGREIFKQEYQL